MTHEEQAKQILLAERKKLRAIQEKLVAGKPIDGDAALRIAERLHHALTQLVRA